MKAVISELLSEKYSFYSVSPDQLENSKDTKECYVKLRNLKSETIKLFSKDATVEEVVKPGQTTAQVQEHVPGKHISYL